MGPDARIPVIFVTMTKTADTAIEAMKQGAFDYLFKPLDLKQVRRVVGEALEVGRRMRAPAVSRGTRMPTRRRARYCAMYSRRAMRGIGRAI